MRRHLHCSLIHKFKFCAKSTKKRRRIEQCLKGECIREWLKIVFVNFSFVLRLFNFKWVSSFSVQYFSVNLMFEFGPFDVSHWKLLSKYLDKSNSKFFSNVYFSQWSGNFFNFTKFIWTKSWNISRSIHSELSLILDSWVPFVLSYSNNQHKHRYMYAWIP